MKYKVLMVFMVFAMILAGCGAGQSEVETKPEVTIDVEVLLGQRCASCHTHTIVSNFSYSLEEWTEVIDVMVKKGATLSDEEKAAMIQYLADTYPAK